MSEPQKKLIDLKSWDMSDRSRIFMPSARLASHILPVSGTMIGVCVTLVGLVKVAEARSGTGHVDEYAALAAISFFASSLTSYLSIRYSNKADAEPSSEGYSAAP
jgi:hypothetical protein